MSFFTKTSKNFSLTGSFNWLLTAFVTLSLGLGLGLSLSLMILVPTLSYADPNSISSEKPLSDLLPLVLDKELIAEGIWQDSFDQKNCDSSDLASFWLDLTDVSRGVSPKTLAAQIFAPEQDPLSANCPQTAILKLYPVKFHFLRFLVTDCLELTHPF